MDKLDRKFRESVKSGSVKAATVRKIEVQMMGGSIAVTAITRSQTNDAREAYKLILSLSQKGYDLPGGRVLAELQRRAQAAPMKPQPKTLPGITLRPARRSASRKAMVRLENVGRGVNIFIPGSNQPENYRDTSSALDRLQELIRQGYSVDRQAYHSLRLREGLPGSEAGGIRRARLKR